MPRLDHGVLRLQLDIEIADRSENAGEPSQLVPEVAGTEREDVGEEVQGGAQAPGGHPHLVQLFDVFPQPGTGLLCSQDAELATQDGVGHITQGRFGFDLGRSEIGRARDDDAARQEASLEFGERGGPQSARLAELQDERRQHIRPLGEDLDLHPPDLHGTLPASDDDLGVIERDVRSLDAIDAEHKWHPSRADIEHRAQGPAPGDGMDPATHRAFGTERADAALREIFGGFERSKVGRFSPARRLEGDLVVPPVPPGTNDEASSRHPPITGVEVGIDQTHRRLGLRSQRPPVIVPDGQRGERRQPALNRAKVERVELPLDPDDVRFVTHLARVLLVHPRNGEYTAQRCARRRVPTVGSRTTTMEFDNSTEVVQAAGGLLVRRQAGQIQIALVHRPIHQDWSYPKGKLEEGETFEEAAQREVFEETGFICRLLRFIGHTEYIDRKGRPKVVGYWVMSAEAGSFEPNEEVDELRWLDIASAGLLLTYERDRSLLAAMLADDQLESLV